MLTAAALEEGIGTILRSPTEAGRLELIVLRPEVDERRLVSDAWLDPVEGVVGDTWRRRPSSRAADGLADPAKQVTVMNLRAAELVAGGRERVPLAGDQLYVDLDISVENLRAGSQLAIGSSVIEISAAPHRGCRKFAERFGAEALRFVNSELGNALRLRGLNARVVVPGVVRLGDAVRKLPAASR